MKESFTLTAHFPVDAATIYNAWLNSHEHTAMTGGDAHCSSNIGEAFSAWDGYISGENTFLTPGQEIIQTWRTTAFDPEDEDSVLTIRLKDTASGCELTLVHTNIPEGQRQYEQGWIDHYFEPMKAYFGT